MPVLAHEHSWVWQQPDLCLGDPAQRRPIASCWCGAVIERLPRRPGESNVRPMRAKLVRRGSPSAALERLPFRA